MGLFIVEGEKGVLEVLTSDFVIEVVFVTQEFKHAFAKQLKPFEQKIQIVDAGELRVLGTLEQNNDALAVVRQKLVVVPVIDQGLTLVLDDIRDPGNLGTLIRIADWYGIKQIVCSSSCVDWYNPKVISASMGSFARVNGFYTDLPGFLAKIKTPILGAFLEGESVHTYKFPKTGILVIGSESHGISREVARYITQKITIPRRGQAESLNAGVAGGIIIDRWVGK